MEKANIIERLRRRWKNELPACVDCIFYYTDSGEQKCAVPVAYRENLVTGHWKEVYETCGRNRYGVNTYDGHTKGICGTAGKYFKPKDVT